MQAAAEDPAVAAQLSQQVILDSKVRECDLLQSQMLLKEARPCWEGAQRLFPQNILVLNELGNVLSQVQYFLHLIYRLVYTMVVWCLIVVWLPRNCPHYIVLLNGV